VAPRTRSTVIRENGSPVHVCFSGSSRACSCWTRGTGQTIETKPLEESRETAKEASPVGGGVSRGMFDFRFAERLRLSSFPTVYRVTKCTQ